MNTYPMIERRAANRPPPAAPVGDAFGLRGALDSFFQYGRLVAVVFCTVFGAALLYALLATPVYRADTLLQIDARPRSALIPGLPGTERGLSELERTMVSAEIEVLGSREAMLPVIAAMGADINVSGARRYGFVPIGARHGIEVPEFGLPDSQLDRDFKLTVEAGRWELTDDKGLLVRGGNVGKTEHFPLAGGVAWIRVQAPADVPKTKLTVSKSSLVLAHTDIMTRMRMFESSRESGVVRISYEDSNPLRAAALLNGLVARYIDLSIQRKQDESGKALANVESQIPEILSRLEASEDALSKYQQKSKAAPPNTEADALLRQRGDLERQGVELRIKRDLLSQTLTASHPDLAGVLRQIATVEGALGRLSGDAGRLPVQYRDVVRLQREVQSQTQVYTAMLNQAQQLRINGTGWMPNARQLDRAAVPVERQRPKLAAVLSVGAGAGLVLALLAALMARGLQTTISSAQELQSSASPPTLAIIPESQAQQRLMDGRLTNDGVIDELGTHRLLARAMPDDPAIEGLRSVHLFLMLRERVKATKVIMVTSPATGTGKSFVAANLAVLMGESGKSVLLIETDLRNPGLYKLVGIDEFSVGLSDLLARTQTLDGVIHQHPSAGMDVMLQGTSTAKAGPLLLSLGFEAAIAELRERYDYIIINAAPMLPSRDALAVGRLADFALMVVRAEQSELQETRVALRRLEENGIKLDGMLFNGVKRKRMNAPLLT